jgi:hypothetical protein
MEMEQPSTPSFRFGAVTGGLIVLTVGAAMLLDSTGTFDIRIGRLIGPLVMIAIGASMLLKAGGGGWVCGARGGDAGPGRRGRHGRRSGFGGLWLIGIGSWMLVSQTHLFGLDFDNSWPLIVILAGVLIMIRGMR